MYLEYFVDYKVVQNLDGQTLCILVSNSIASAMHDI